MNEQELRTRIRRMRDSGDLTPAKGQKEVGALVEIFGAQIRDCLGVTSSETVRKFVIKSLEAPAPEGP
jgi:hypothetical protein